jgi:hypothetical protein
MYCKKYHQIKQNIPHLLTSDMDVPHKHWGKADDRNCNYGQPKMLYVESGKNLFCRLNCYYNVF